MHYREITAATGITPEIAYQAGEPMMSRSGEPLGRVWKRSNWTLVLAEGEPPARTLADVLEEALNKVSSQGEFFRRVRSEGGKVEFFVGWFFNCGNTGEEFSSALLGRMAELGINLSLDIYSP